MALANTDNLRYVLPPDFEHRDPNIYGQLHIQTGKLLWLKSEAKSGYTKIKVKFWGDQGQVLRPTNASKELSMLPTAVRYEIRCPIQNFHHYLEDSVRVKVYILDARNDKPIGQSTVNLNMYLKHKLTKDDLSPFEEISDVFPIEKLQKAAGKDSASKYDKIGSLEFKMLSVFDKPKKDKASDMSSTGMINTADNYLNSSFLANEMKAKSGEGTTEVLPKDFYSSKESPDKRTPQQGDPNLLYNRDVRIPNSLLKAKDDSKYNADFFKGPQNIFSIEKSPERNISPQKQQQQQQQNQYSGSKANEIFNTGAPSLYKAHREENKMRREFDEERFDSQIDQLILKTKDLTNQMMTAEGGQRGESFDRTFGLEGQRQSYNQRQRVGGASGSYIPNFDFDKNALNKDHDLERIRLELEGAALLGGADAKERGSTNAPQRDAGNDEGELHFSQIDTLKVNVMEFDCSSEILNKRMGDGNVFVECLVPASSSTPDNPIFDDYKFYAKDHARKNWVFNNEIAQRILPKDGEFKKLFDAIIQIKVFLAPSKPSEPAMEIASGEINLEKVILSPGYQGTFFIKMQSKAPTQNQPAQTAKTQKKGSKITKVPAAQLVKKETAVEVGEMKIKCQFTSSKRNASSSNVEKVIDHSAVMGHGSYTNLQMMLYIEKIPKVVPRADKEFPFRNVYISYKIYGSNEGVRTDVRWRTNTPYIDHKMVIPISQDHMQKMDVLPFILEVWDKDEISADQLVGIVNIGLGSVPRALVDPETQEINYEFLKTNQYPLLICDDIMPIKDLGDEEKGQVQIVLAIGTPVQLNKFETRIKERRDRYSENYDIKGRAHTRHEQPSTPEEDRKPKREQPPKKEESPFQKYEIDDKEDDRVPLKSNYEVFLDVMEMLRKKSDPTILQAMDFWKSRDPHTTSKEFIDFLAEPSFTIRSGYSKKLAKLLDVQSRGLFSREYFTKSYESYLNCEMNVRDKFTKILKNLKAMLSEQDLSVSSFDKALNAHSEFGYIKKPALKATFHEKRIQFGQETLEFMLNMLDYGNDGYIFVNHLTDYLKALDVYETLNYLNINHNFFMAEVTHEIVRALKSEEIPTDKIDAAFEEYSPLEKTLSIIDCQRIFTSLGYDLTFWEMLSLIEFVKRKMNSLIHKDIEIIGLVLYNWLLSIVAPDTDRPRTNAHAPPQKEEIQNVSEIKSEEADPRDYRPPKKQEQLPSISPDKYENPELRNSTDSQDDLIKFLNPSKNSQKKEELPDIKEENPRKEDPPKYKSKITQSNTSFGKISSIYDRKQESRVVDRVVKEVASGGGIDEKRLEQILTEKLAGLKPQEVNTDEIVDGLMGKMQSEVLQRLLTALEERLPKPEVKEEPVVEAEPEKKEPILRANKKTLKHTINFKVIGLSQLNLGHSLSGSNCQIRYSFPNNSDVVESNSFKYQSDTKEYDAEVSSQHLYTLYRGDSLLQHMQNPSDGIVVQLIQKGDYEDEVLGYTVVPLDDLSQMFENASPLDPDNSNIKSSVIRKSYLLFKSQQQSKQNFSFSNNLTLGKMLIVVEYQSEHPVEEVQEDYEEKEKETIYEQGMTINRTIPRKGFLNFHFEAINDLKKGLDYAIEQNESLRHFMDNKLNASAKLAIHVDLFKGDEELQEFMPPFEYEVMRRQIDFNEIVIDNFVSKPLEMTADIIEHLQNRSAYLEIRLYLVEDENADDRSYITISSASIPLLQILTSQNGVQGEFALTNQVGCYSGVLALHFTFNKENKSQTGRKTDHLRGREKCSYFIMLGLNEIVSLLEEGEKFTFEDDNEAIISFEFEVEREVKRTVLYTFDKRKNRLALTEGNFNFTLESNSDFFKRPLEIKVIEKKKPRYQDKVIGFVTLDFYNLYKDYFPNNKTFVQSFYCPVADIERSKNLKMRLGVKLAMVKVKNNLEAKKLNNYLKNMIGSQTSKDTQLFKEKDAKLSGTINRATMKDILKTKSKLTQGELDDFTSLVSDNNELITYEIFLQEVRADLNMGLNLEAQAWSAFKREFGFYDYTGEGFVDLDAAKMIINHYAEQLNNLDADQVSKFVVSLQLNGLNLGYASRLKSTFDYVVFLNKIDYLNIANEYNKIYENTRRVEAYMSSKLRSATEISTGSLMVSRDFNLHIEIQYGKNFKQLNKGGLPSSLVRVILIPKDQQLDFNESLHPRAVLMETPVCYRANDPDFHQIKDIGYYDLADANINLNDFALLYRVYHRQYNSNHETELHRFVLIGEGLLPITNLEHRDNRIIFNDFVEIRPINITSTINAQARAMLKVKINGELSHQQQQRTNQPIRDASPKPYNSTFGQSDLRKQNQISGNKRTTFNEDILVHDLARDNHERQEIKPLVDPTLENDEIPDFNDEFLKRFKDTLNEVNENAASLQGSAEKVRPQILAAEEEEANPEVDDLLHQGQEAINRIADISRNLDSIFEADGNRIAEKPSQEEESRPEITRSGERTPERKFDTTNPFNKNLSNSLGDKLGQAEENEDAHLKSQIRQDPDTKHLASSTTEENKQQQGASENKQPNTSSGSGSKPPRESSTSSSEARRLANKLPKGVRDSKELSRIANIMKMDFSGSKKNYESDSSDV